MPAYLTHRAAAAKVKEKLEPIKLAHEKAFYLGSQGPDILFFRNYYPWKSSKKTLNLGIAMHHLKVREMFKHGFEFVRNYKGEDRPELISYMAGLVVHYAIDKNAHSFVYDKTGQDNALHNRLEFMWDTIVAHETWGINPTEYNFKQEMDYGEICGGVRQWYCDVAKKLYDTDIKPIYIREAQKHYASAKQALNNIRIPGRAVLWIASKLLRFDTRSLLYSKEIKYDMFSKDEYEHMKSLIEKGVDEAVKMVKFALEYFESDTPKELPKWFGDKDFSGSKRTHATL